MKAAKKRNRRIKMFLNAKNGVLKLENTQMDYIHFGRGEKVLVILPGLGDGLQTVKGTALPMAVMYRVFAKDFTVYAFSRKNDLPQGYTTRDMARDYAQAMDILGIEKADVFGVSMGGMIAQHLAADFPDKVNRLVLTVTSSRPNPILRESVEEWMVLAKKGDHGALMDSNLRRIYSDSYYRKNRWMIPVVGKLTKPASYQRFLIQAQACLAHNAYEKLEQIHAPTLVIGGGKDKALGGEASAEIAAKIPGAELFMYQQWGHGVYEEAKDFNGRLLAFLNGEEG
jgi:pimeloyl-ACP methyl ester carboxylesterase